MGTSSTTPRKEIPIHMDYVDDAYGGVIAWVNNTDADPGFYKFMKSSDCLGWWRPEDGNTSVLDYDINGDEAVGAWCSEYDNSDYKLYDLSKDPYETTNLFQQHAYIKLQKLMQQKFCDYYTDENTVESAFAGYERELMLQAMMNNSYFITHWHDEPWSRPTKPKDVYFELPSFCDSDDS
eukprot:FR739232.1.p1 GENE.FR739232.1~~FR739232.1.p1  ORF type:complete len:180 (+),score=20.90 FR739232.1:255-794(+)